MDKIYILVTGRKGDVTFVSDYFNTRRARAIERARDLNAKAKERGVDFRWYVKTLEKGI